MRSSLHEDVCQDPGVEGYAGERSQLSSFLEHMANAGKLDFVFCGLVKLVVSSLHVLPQRCSSLPRLSWRIPPEPSKTPPALTAG